MPDTLLSGWSANFLPDIWSFSGYSILYIFQGIKKISISHSKKLVAIIVSELKTGIDIEIISERVLKVKNKFLSYSDNIDESQEDLTIAWSTKECIFKWHQKGNLNFKKNELMNGELNGSFSKNEQF